MINIMIMSVNLQYYISLSFLLHAHLIFVNVIIAIIVIYGKEHKL